MFENIKDDLWAIGVGVNIVSAPILENATYQATSLKENAITLDRTDFLRYLLQEFAKDLLFYQENGFALIKEEWLSLALNLNQKITVKNEKTDKTGIFLTLDDNAYLILKTDNGTERILAGDLFS